MRCEQCQQEAKALYKILGYFLVPGDEMAQGDYKMLRSYRVKRICGNCIVGEHVPAYRQTRHNWEIGLVQKYSHQVVDTFEMDFCGTHESVSLDADPFRAYVTHRLEEYPRTPPLDETNLTSPTGRPASVFRNKSSSPKVANSDSSFDEDACLERLFGGNSDCSEPTCTENRQTDAESTPGRSVTRATQPRKWTAKEDRSLKQALIHDPVPPMCQDRHFQCIRPSLDSKFWTLPEDTILWHTFTRLGPKWELISGLVRGRTDREVKERFHWICQCLEKRSLEYSCGIAALPTGSIEQGKDRLSGMIVSLVESCSWQDRSTTSDSSWAKLTKVKQSFICCRCGLLVPSSFTGESACETTGWCSRCVDTQCYFSSDHLRQHHQNTLPSTLKRC